MERFVSRLPGGCMVVVVLGILLAGCPWPPDDTSPPSNVSGLSAVRAGGGILLSWSNPPDPDFSGTLVLRSTTEPPFVGDSSVTVYDGTGEQAQDDQVNQDLTWFYGVFSYDEAGNHASGAFVSVPPSGTGEGEGEGEGEGDGEPEGLREIPDPLSGDNPRYPVGAPAVPGAGQNVVDTTFHTTQVRVTAAERLRHEYSRFDPFNADQSLILLMALEAGEWRIYRTQGVPYDAAGSLWGTVEVEEPRWDPADSTLLWGIDGFRLVTVRMDTRAVATVKDFAADPVIAPILTQHPDLYRITMRDEGESSWDKRYWAFLIQGTQEDYRVRYLFTWDRETDTILGVRELSAAESIIDWAGMSPNGSWVLIGGDWDNGGDLAGLVMADRALTQFHQLDYATGHADVGLDSDGNEVLVMQGVRTDYIDLIPLDLATTPITSEDWSYAGTNRTPLIRLFYDSESPLGLNSGVHISCNVPGYCVVSTYIEPGVQAQNWLDRKIVLVRLDREAPRAWYLAQVYATRGAYWEETQAAISNDGGRVVWATNWNQHVGEERVWLVQLTMPAGWNALP